MKFFKLLLFFTLIGNLYSQDAEFYAYIQKTSKVDLELGLKKIESVKNEKLKEIYKGALLAKSAQFEKTPKEKVQQFKSGIKPIEQAINMHPENIEYRFIRLIIQENSPQILKYKSNLEEDKILIKNGFKSTSKILKENIEKYSKSSKILIL